MSKRLLSDVFLYHGHPPKRAKLKDIARFIVDPATNLVSVQLHEGLMKIGSNAFHCCGSLESITLPSTVHVIGGGAFGNCTKLGSVKLQEGLERIARGAFRSCKSLESITIPSAVQMISHGAFFECTNLMCVHLNEGLRKIEGCAFFDCTSLESIKIPSTVEVIEESAFANCQQLKNVQLQEGLMEIGAKAFHGCVSLESIVLPSTVKLIGRKVFINCVKLVNVQLNEGLNSMGGQVFLNCMSLEQIVIPSSVVEVQSLEVFKNCTSLVTVKFDNDFEVFVSETSLRTWWNRGVAKHALSTYCFLAKHGVVNLFGTLQASKWQNTILDMLERIPAIACEKKYSHLKSMLSKITIYNRLGDIATLLELALWKSNVFNHCLFCLKTNVNLSAVELQQLRMGCGAAIVIPNVLSFLLVERPNLL